MITSVTGSDWEQTGNSMLDIKMSFYHDYNRFGVFVNQNQKFFFIFPIGWNDFPPCVLIGQIETHLGLLYSSSSSSVFIIPCLSALLSGSVLSQRFSSCWVYFVSSSSRLLFTRLLLALIVSQRERLASSIIHQPGETWPETKSSPEQDRLQPVVLQSILVNINNNNLREVQINIETQN